MEVDELELRQIVSTSIKITSSLWIHTNQWIWWPSTVSLLLLPWSWKASTQKLEVNKVKTSAFILSIEAIYANNICKYIIYKIYVQLLPIKHFATEISIWFPWQITLSQPTNMLVPGKGQQRSPVLFVVADKKRKTGTDLTKSFSNPWIETYCHKVCVELEKYSCIHM